MGHAATTVLNIPSGIAIYQTKEIYTGIITLAYFLQENWLEKSLFYDHFGFYDGTRRSSQNRSKLKKSTMNNPTKTSSTKFQVSMSFCST